MNYYKFLRKEKEQEKLDKIVKEISAKSGEPYFKVRSIILDVAYSHPKKNYTATQAANLLSNHLQMGKTFDQIKKKWLDKKEYKICQDLGIKLDSDIDNIYHEYIKEAKQHQIDNLTKEIEKKQSEINKLKQEL